MKKINTLRAEETVEVNFGSLRGSAVEALRVMFTPVGAMIELFFSRRRVVHERRLTSAGRGSLNE